MPISKVFLLAVAVAGALGVQPGTFSTRAAAAEETTDRVTQVTTQGLDLAAPAGQAALVRRVEHAARQVCGLFDEPIAPLSRAYIDCHAQALAEAMQQVRTLVAQANAHTQMARAATP